MGDKRNFVKRLFWLKQASIRLHDIPKDAKIQHLGFMFSKFIDFFIFQEQIMISEFWKYNGYNEVLLYFYESKIMIFYFKNKKKSKMENSPQKIM